MKIPARPRSCRRALDGRQFQVNRARVVLRAGQPGELDILIGAFERHRQRLARYSSTTGGRWPAPPVRREPADQRQRRKPRSRLRILEQRRAEVPFGGVRKDVTIVFPANSGKFAETHRDRRRRPHEMPHRMPSSFASRRAISIRLLVGHRLDVVDHRQVERIGNEPGADALNLVRPRLERLARQLLAITGLFVGSTPTERIFFPFFFLMYRETPLIVPPVPTPGHQDVDLAAGVFPDLRAGGPEVDLRVRRILELLKQHEPSGRDATISSAFAMEPAMPCGPSVRISFAPERLQHLPALEGHRFRHRQRDR